MSMRTRLWIGFAMVGLLSVGFSLWLNVSEWRVQRQRDQARQWAQQVEHQLRRTQSLQDYERLLGPGQTMPAARPQGQAATAERQLWHFKVERYHYHAYVTVVGHETGFWYSHMDPFPSPWGWELHNRLIGPLLNFAGLGWLATLGVLAALWWLPDIRRPVAEWSVAMGIGYAVLVLCVPWSSRFHQPALAGMACFLLGSSVTLWWWLRRAERRRQAGLACAACSYDLTGNTSGTCPECGAPLSARQRIRLHAASSPTSPGGPSASTPA